MKTITVINQKGGVGKTSTAFGIGCALRQLKRRTLFIDLDPQANLTFATGAEAAIGSTTTHKANTGELLIGAGAYTVRDALVDTPVGPVLTAGTQNGDVERAGGQGLTPFTLRALLSDIDAEFDYAIIDTPPALGMLTINALTASDGVVVPVLADAFSLRGLSQLSETINVVRANANKGLRIYGLVLSRFNARSGFNKAARKELETQAAALGTRLFDCIIRECVAIKEAQGFSENLYTYAPRSAGAEDYLRLAQELLTTIKRDH